MHILLSLLFFIGSSSAKKEGDFGVFSACTINNSLRLNCHYANCSTPSPPFDCKFMTSNRSLLAEATNEKCWHILRGHRLHHANKTTNYTCILTRRKRKEEKHITIDYSTCRGKNCIRPCRNMLGLLPHRAPAALWPVVFLSLWRVLSTDNQTT